MMLAFATATALAASSGNGPPAVASDFDLTRAKSGSVPRERAAPRAPVVPRGMDLRDFAVDAPELELPLAQNGPRLLVGAFGGRGSGMPKLAHVGLGWRF